MPPCKPSLSPVRRCSAQPTLDLKAGKGMSGFFEVKLKVRDCGLDQFLVYVLNYVVPIKCLCWMTQTGRDELMECIGSNSNEVAQSGDAIAVSELSLKLFQPLRSGDKVVKVRISGSSGAQVYLDHLIFKLPYEEIKTCAIFFAMRSLTQHNDAREILLLETLEKKMGRAKRIPISFK
ncbi:hypothetical protein SLA2020_089490 [Shorea laevis]